MSEHDERKGQKKGLKGRDSNLRLALEESKLKLFSMKEQLAVSASDYAYQSIVWSLGPTVAEKERYFVGDLISPSFLFEEKESNSSRFNSSRFLVNGKQDAARRSLSLGRQVGFYDRRYVNSTAWIDQLAPTLPGPSSRTKPIKLKWDDDVNRLVESLLQSCLLYTSPSPRDQRGSRMPSSA